MAEGSRIIFMGTPEFAVPSLERLARRHGVAAVFSQPPRPSGRGMKARPSPVQVAAEGLGIDVLTPAEIDDDAVSQLRELSPDFLVVVAYGLVLPEEVLEIPGRAALNGHASLLPRWRGAAPIHRAIEAGDEVTGTTAMQMAAALDSGPVLLSREEAIRPDDTAASLHDRLAPLTAEVLVEAVDRFGDLDPVPQDETAVTWARKVSPAEAELDFGEAAEALERRIRAFAPSPGAWISTAEGDGKPRRVKVLAASMVADHDPAGAEPGTVLGHGPDGGPLVATADAALELTSVQPQGKAAMDGAAFLNGYTLPAVIRHLGGAVPIGITVPPDGPED